jgi:exodeoxyribonuclease VII large subunit
MSQLPLFEPSYWTVTELTSYLRDLIESDQNLQDVWVQGEVSNLSHPRSGHLYFTLKDSNSSLRCVMWRNAVHQQGFIPRDGQSIEVHGGISIYEVQGQYQLYADHIRPLGEGALYQEFLRLKSRLEEEGLFSTDRKRPVPLWPHRIGIVTSPTGAALRDILNTFRRRYPLAEVILAPSTVQGMDAPEQIAAAIRTLNERITPDVILLVRGGGSIEDLWAFNDERVARAIADSHTPVITGVGHETDFTIADFVADLRAPTPTAAAELATPNRTDLLASVGEINKRLVLHTRTYLEDLRFRLNNQKNRLDMRSPMTNIYSSRQRLDENSHRVGYALQQRLRFQRAQLNGLASQLSALNPRAVLQRGYASITKVDGELVKSVHQVGQHEHLQVHITNGDLDVRVEEIIPKPNE